MRFKKSDDVDQEAESEEGKPRSSQGGTTFGYRVEARVLDFSPTNPILIPQPQNQRPLMLTEKWQEVSFWEGNNPAGVPVAGCGHDENLFRIHGLLERQSALALAYTLAAQHSRHSLTSIQLRLVQHKLRYEHKLYVEGEPEELTQHYTKTDKFLTKTADD